MPKPEKLRLYIIHHAHRHGDSIWPVLAAATPTVEAIAAQDPDTFELHREDEHLQVIGPFDPDKIDIHRP